MALHEPPHYKSARHDPGIDRAWYQIVGYDTAKEVLDYCRAGHVDRGLAALDTVLGTVDMSLPTSPRRALLSLLFHRGYLRLRGLRFRERHATAQRGLRRPAGAPAPRVARPPVMSPRLPRRSARMRWARFPCASTGGISA